MKIKEILIDEKYKIGEKSRSLIIINLFKISRTLRVALKFNCFFKLVQTAVLIIETIKNEYTIIVENTSVFTIEIYFLIPCVF